jgi:hypothetical protein
MKRFHTELTTKEKSLNETGGAFDARELCHWLPDDHDGRFLVPHGFIRFLRLWWE